MPSLPKDTQAAPEVPPLPPSGAAPGRIYEIEGNLASVETMIMGVKPSWEKFLAEDHGKQADYLKAKIKAHLKLLE